ncbi:MAG: murein biosynthesis integral membrane protein MurJ [Clostridia bacterium]
MLKAMIKIIILTLGYRILGFIRDILIATKFGSGMETDAFFLAQSLPNLILEILAIGAFSTALVPILLEKKLKLNEITGNFLLIFSLISILGIMLSNKIVLFLAPGFGDKEVKLASEFSKIFFSMIPLIILSEINSSILISKNKSIKITESNLINNLLLILFSVFLLRTFGIKAFVYGTIFGTLFKVIYLLYINKFDFNLFSIRVNLKNKDFYKIIILIFPIMLSSIGNQINFIVDRKIASTLLRGGISTLNYAYKIVQLPLGIILGAVILSSFPLVIRSIQDSNREEYVKLIKNKIEIILVTMLFIVIIVLLYSEKIIEIVYKRGNFTNEDVKITAEILRYYIFSIIFISLTTVFQKIFHAYKRTKLPAAIEFIGVILNIGLNISLSKLFGIKGLALATTMSSGCVCLIMFVFLKIEKKIFFNIKKIIQIILSNALIILTNNLVVRIFLSNNGPDIYFILVFGVNTLFYMFLILKIYNIKFNDILKKIRRNEKL